jgi:hypothetical protein
VYRALSLNWYEAALDGFFAALLVVIGDASDEKFG